MSVSTRTMRCRWCGDDPLYMAYHDDEWGVPEHDDRALFEKLVLDGFQAGLSWIIILKKRAHMREVFDHFEPTKIAHYRPAKIERLLADPGIIRNRAKVEGAVSSARAYLQLRKSEGSFAEFLWRFVEGRPRQNHWTSMRQLPTQSPESVAMAKALKTRGFKFCGPTITYAFMQAVGMVNDHLVDCFRYRAVARMSRNPGGG